jgi:hypothetical protein
MKNTVGFFLHKSVFSKIHYKHEIVSWRISLNASKNFSQPPKELYNNNCVYINKTENKKLIENIK